MANIGIRDILAAVRGRRFNERGEQVVPWNRRMVVSAHDERRFNVRLTWREFTALHGDDRGSHERVLRRLTARKLAAALSAVEWNVAVEFTPLAAKRFGRLVWEEIG